LQNFKYQLRLSHCCNLGARQIIATIKQTAIPAKVNFAILEYLGAPSRVILIWTTPP